MICVTLPRNLRHFIVRNASNDAMICTILGHTLRQAVK